MGYFRFTESLWVARPQHRSVGDVRAMKHAQKVARNARLVGLAKGQRLWGKGLEPKEAPSKIPP